MNGLSLFNVTRNHVREIISNWHDPLGDPFCVGCFILTYVSLLLKDEVKYNRIPYHFSVFSENELNPLCFWASFDLIISSPTDGVISPLSYFIFRDSGV